MAKQAVISPEINYLAFSTACRPERLCRAMRSLCSCGDADPQVEYETCEISLDIVGKGILTVKM